MTSQTLGQQTVFSLVVDRHLDRNSQKIEKAKKKREKSRLTKNGVHAADPPADVPPSAASNDATGGPTAAPRMVQLAPVMGSTEAKLSSSEDSHT